MKVPNWGQSLIIFFIFYIGFLITAVVKSQQRDHSLVVDDYYQHDIEYQDRYYDAVTNTHGGTSGVAVELIDSSQEVALTFEQSDVILKGEVQFYRPSDKSADFTEQFELINPNKRIVFETDKIKKGKWILKVRWTDGIKVFYKEKVIILSPEA